MMSTILESDHAESEMVRQLTEIYDDHKDLLFSFSLSIVGNRHDAEDVLQILFQKLWRDRDRWEQVKNWRAWLLRLTRNHALDFIKSSSRSRKREEEVGMEPFFQASEGLSVKCVEEIHLALQKLDEPSRSLVLLKFFKELTFEEMGQVLEISSSTASTRFYEAMDRLRSIWTKNNNIFL